MRPHPDDLHGELRLAHELADLADAVTIPLFRDVTLRVDRKADRTEVTAADRGAEAAIRARLAEVRPHHAVLGEEEGLVGRADSAWRWVVDPIDGTSNYVKGVPIWATLVALLHEGEPVVGLVAAPALGRRWWAVRGGGAFAGPSLAGGAPVRVSTVGSVAEAHLAHAGIESFAAHGRLEGLVDLASRVWRGRGLGDFWMHVLVAEGCFDAAAECIVNPWDVAAVQVVVEEAGGRFTDLEGRPGFEGGSALSTNGLLHDEVLAALRPR